MTQTTTQNNNLMPLLIKALTSATSNLYLAIGWLGEKSIFGLLEKKLLKGVSLKMVLIKDESNQQNQAAYDALVQQGAQLYWLDKIESEKLIDHKFVLVDQQLVLTGNYNWGHKNPPKEETLTISTAIPTLSQGFAEEFDYLSVLDQLSKATPRPKNSIGELLQKLNILKVLLSIGDTEFIHLRLQILEEYPADENIQNIHQAILHKEFDQAHELIKTFVQYHVVLQDSIEPPVENLRREIQRLEEEITSISQEFNETQKVIHEFSKLHSQELGDLLQKILFQSKVKAAYEAKIDAANAAKQAEFEEAQNDHEEYTKSFEASKKQQLNTLTPAQKKELKKLYRQTSLRCHPDRVVEELHEQAEEIFVELNKAYKANDLERVKAINEQVKTGAMLSKSETITELKKLESTVSSLRQKLQDWLDKLDKLKAMPTFQTVSSIDDWSIYFKETKVVLADQLERLLLFNEEINISEQKLLAED